MATFNVIARTARPHMYEPGDKFVCPDDEVQFHCDSVALVPFDEDTRAAILAYAPDSKAAKKIEGEKEAAAKDAKKVAEAKKKKAEIAAKEAAEAELAAKAAAKDAK